MDLSIKESFDKINNILSEGDQKLIETKLTGNYYFKPSWLGMIIMIEKNYCYSDGYAVKRFEKAKISDLFGLGLVVTPLNNLANA